MGLPPDIASRGSREGGGATAALLPGEEEKAAAVVAKEPGLALDGVADFLAAAAVSGSSHSSSTRTSFATCVFLCV